MIPATIAFSQNATRKRKRKSTYVDILLVASTILVFLSRIGQRLPSLDGSLGLDNGSGRESREIEEKERIREKERRKERKEEKKKRRKNLKDSPGRTEGGSDGNNKGNDEDSREHFLWLSFNST